ncbi:MAG: 4Fe-4S binding protein [Syntrophorhabdus aromaticivorans]|uniref:Indolepyruvate oxidoreductase subunit IorA n=1 Tax=Syntrophorhabdus aromaticivorans TaxID=328301 RepID=A0A971S130_9BACT|nr:4Fe-4S binding protein [Syntrophorhabdus aromaticivorans]
MKKDNSTRREESGVPLKTTGREAMIGNFAIARGLVEAGLDLAAAYPGTPSSEILPGIIEFNRREKGNIHAEWSTNEKCAFEVAFGAALAGRKAACMMKQVGLNVAFPSLLKGRHKAIQGGLVVVSCDDPGPQSSQTEQDTRLLASLFNIPVFDPASPKEAGDIAYYALQYSYEHKTPVIIRPTHRVSHAREMIDLFSPGLREVTLNEGVKSGKGRKLGIVASGMSYALARDVISELVLEEVISLYKVVRVFPLERGVMEFVAGCDRVLVLEETDAVLEVLIDGGERVFGRRSGHVPGQGELTYDVVRGIVQQVTAGTGIKAGAFIPDPAIEEAMKGVNVLPRPPKLCAGCPHRASFFAMAYAYPDAVFPGDIGCYTLGIAMGAVDTCLDMGGGVTLASGFYDTFKQDGDLVPILASVGDSTFFHACLPPLYDAAQKKKQFILVIMDNGTTAMTGMQPTPQTGITADGSPASSIMIEDIVKGFGIEFVRIIDPYDIPLMIATAREAYDYLGKEGKGPAVIIARRECILTAKGKNVATWDMGRLEEDCIGCKACVKAFDCPGLAFDEERRKIRIDEGVCVKCGMCYFACPTSAEGKGLRKFQDKHSRVKG